MQTGDVRKINIFDTSATTDNIGDEIIMTSVRMYLREIFPFGFFTNISSQDYPGKISLQKAIDCDFSFVGGTNILTSRFWHYRQFRIRYSDVMKMKPVILLGVGWHKYQPDPDFVTNIVHRRLLSKDYLHSVRDVYTAKKLQGAGIKNVLYTGCPTMWRLTEEHLSKIPTKKADNVLLTLTAYLHDHAADRALADLLAKRYDTVYFWPQMFDDMEYLEKLCPEYLASGKIKVVKPSLEDVTHQMRAGNIDYIGTRLHCGALGLQNHVRSLVVTVDNRAAEISRDTGLHVMARHDIDGIDNWIGSDTPIRMILPFDDIQRWKDQFR